MRAPAIVATQRAGHQRILESARELSVLSLRRDKGQRAAPSRAAFASHAAAVLLFCAPDDLSHTIPYHGSFRLSPCTLARDSYQPVAAPRRALITASSDHAQRWDRHAADGRQTAFLADARRRTRDHQSP